MVKVTFLSSDNEEYIVEVAQGSSLMEAARQNGIPGIEADCGGACACGTCHIYIPSDWTNKIAAPKESEREMLEFVTDGQDNSRLSCQIIVEDQLDGLTIHIPASQN